MRLNIMSVRIVKTNFVVSLIIMRQHMGIRTSKSPKRQSNLPQNYDLLATLLGHVFFFLKFCTLATKTNTELVNSAFNGKKITNKKKKKEEGNCKNHIHRCLNDEYSS